nr:NAC domain-containing protein 30-like [Coffea arabica]XP_027092720.1 NAC domain-containing protein 30-like [Coffea arabica]
MEMESCVPPGFRFHPTEEELVGYYLNRKVNSLKIDLDVIVDIDLYRMEPWDIQDRCKLGYEEQNEWYFFSHKDRKYPTGTRTNRATAAGFWKATGRDKAVISKEKIIGMRKTLVFYKGRAPNGRKTDWIMHEYRLQTSEQGPSQEEGWVVCRAFKKPCPSHKQGFEAWSNAYYIRENGKYQPPSFPDKSITSMHAVNPISIHGVDFQQVPLRADHHELISNHAARFDNQLIEIPQLDSPSISTSLATKDQVFESGSLVNEDGEDVKSNIYCQQYNDWKVFDKLLVQQVIDPSASYACQNQPVLLPRDDELLLGCFTDL